MSSATTLALGIRGSDSGGSIGQPMVSEVIPIRDSSSEAVSVSHGALYGVMSDKGSDNESSYFERLRG